MDIKSVETEAEWEAAVAIRRRVFVEEQACPPEEEWDEYDAVSRHLLGVVDGVPAATARWRPYPARPSTAKLERFAVLPEFRGGGLGRQLVAFTIRDAEAAGFPSQLIHAQAHLQVFYETLGFRAEGERFDEAGIPHVRMIRHGPDA